VLHRLCLSLLLICIALAATIRAAHKPFWFDEILTLTIARLPPGPEMWAAMKAGFEFNPPLLYLATHAATALFGETHIGARLPQLLAGIAALLAGFIVVSRRSGPLGGFWFVLLIGETALYSFFYEARPYAMVFLGTMLAWLAWQKIANDPQPPLAKLLLLVLPLVFAVLSHLWAMVVVGSFFAAALAVSFEQKRWAWRHLAATFLPILAVAASLPVIRANRGVVFAGNVYIPSLWTSSVGFYIQNMGTFLLVVFLTVLAFLAWRKLTSPTEPAVPFDLSHVPLHEIVLALALLFSPFVILAITRLTHNAHMARYALVACIGAAFLAAHILTTLGTKCRLVAVSIMLGLSLVYALQIGRSALRGFASPGGEDDDLSYLSSQPYAQLPIVFAQPIVFLKADLYTPRELSSRFLYTVDRRLAVQLAQTDGVDSALLAASKWLRLNGKLISYEELVRDRRKFVLLDDEISQFNWISRKLRADGARLTAIADPSHRVLLCELP
jgi:hypothetical protein